VTSAVSSAHGSSRVVNALSFDIEDWFHIVEIEALSDTGTWPKLPSLVEPYTEWILETLAEADVRATFFVLGWVAEHHPRIVPMIAKAGHELGTHSYWHRKVYEMTPEELHDDLKSSVDLIESQSGRKVLGFRAPSFSIVPGTEWAFDVLHDLGLVYDASLFPARRNHGGYLCPREPHRFTKAPSGRPMPELPMSLMDVLGRALPFSGGGYLRLLPRWVIRRGFDDLNGKGLPVVVYLHPRDFAPDCPRVPMPLGRRFKSYVGIRSAKGKLRMLLERYRFDTCAAVMGLDEEKLSAAV
jgi:polysaccharide deacetylase family protein (PEP-CTERM system associated)